MITNSGLGAAGIPAHLIASMEKGYQDRDFLIDMAKRLYRIFLKSNRDR
jgi:hypothetical protein